MINCTCGQDKALADIHYPYCAVHRPFYGESGIRAAWRPWRALQGAGEPAVDLGVYSHELPPRVHDNPSPVELEKVIKICSEQILRAKEKGSGFSGLKIPLEAMERRYARDVARQIEGWKDADQ